MNAERTWARNSHSRSLSVGPKRTFHTILHPTKACSTSNHSGCIVLAEEKKPSQSAVMNSSFPTSTYKKVSFTSITSTKSAGFLQKSCTSSASQPSDQLLRCWAAWITRTSKRLGLQALHACLAVRNSQLKSTISAACTGFRIASSKSPCIPVFSA